MSKKHLKPAAMILHTHWDREWYLTKEQFRPKLVRLIDGVLQMAETLPAELCFLLDGQLIALEDYLELRPQNKARIEKAVKAGRIQIGPWYVLPDEMLISGEAHIRNFLQGKSVCDALGGAMNVGYLPDSFGHPEQMPQIIAGLGLEAIVFWRGTNNSIKNSEFIWHSPYEKAAAFCIHLPNGYGNSACLSENADESIERMQSMIADLSERSIAKSVLLMNGSDHILLQENIAGIIKAYNETADEDAGIRLSTLPDFVQEVKSSVNEEEIEHISGEMRSGDRCMLLGGTLSARVKLKQMNMQVQRGMERILEPLNSAAVLSGAGINGFGDYQKLLWRKILENHPHDSICGCSIDEVHSEMETRFACTQQLEETLCADVFTSLCGTSKAAAEQGMAELLLFEPTQDKLPACIEATVDFDPLLISQVNFARSIIDEYEADAHPPLPLSVQAFDENGTEIPCELLSAQKAEYMFLQDETAPEIYLVNRCHVRLLTKGASFGIGKISLCALDVPPKQNKAEQQENAKFIENEFYVIGFNDENNSLYLEEKKTGRRHDDFINLIDGGDAGDEYTYSWPENDSFFTLKEAQMQAHTEQAQLKSSLILQGSMQLPQAISTNRKSRMQEMVACPFSFKISLMHGIEQAAFELDFNNKAKDHRLQLEVACGVLGAFSHAQSAFGVTQHAVEQKISEEWVEYPFGTHVNHGFIALDDAKHGAALASKGMMEYEAVNKNGESFLRLTLMRCVGWLSRADLATRKGNGGWSIKTPAAQCLGNNSFSWALQYYEGAWQNTQAFATAERFLNPPLLHQAHLRKARQGQQNPLAFLSALPQDIRFSALKNAEDENGLILRLFSISTEQREFCLELPCAVKEVCSVNLAEQKPQPVCIENNSVKLVMQPGQILSLRVVVHKANKL